MCIRDSDRSFSSGLGPRNSAPLRGFRGEPVGALRGSSASCPPCNAWRDGPSRCVFAREDVALRRCRAGT
eukprot:12064682-Alexandrium_andersonii.AAC.1